MANATTPVIQINEGLVGIGTVSPGYKLEVTGNITAKAGGDVFVNSIATTTTGRAFIKNIGDLGSVLVSAVYGSASTGTIFGVSATRAASIITTSDTGTHPSSLVIGTFTEIPLYLGTNDSSRITILGSGNVGINDTSPDFTLDVGGTLGVSDLPFNSSSVSVLVADETIGAELITNGDFATDSDWTKETGWSISSGVASYDGSAANNGLYENLSLTTGSTYKLVFTIVNYVSGTLVAALSSGTLTGNTPNITANGTYAFDLTATGVLCIFRSTSSFNGSIDNVSLKQVTSASNQIQKSELNTIPRTNPAASLYDLIPNGAFTTTYAFTSTAGTYAEVMSGNDVITATGTYSVQMIVNDFAVGGTQYDEKYSGVMTWHVGSVNDNGQGAESEIVLHRAGHAANSGITYLRTRETTNTANPGPNELKLEIMGNRTYTAASNVIFKFVRLI